MIFRVLFGMLIVCALVPHEPDIGFGQPTPRRLLIAAAADLRGVFADAQRHRPAAATRPVGSRN